MQSFFSLLQKNVLNRRRWRSRTELRLAIMSWTESIYHRRRRQDTLGRLAPVEFETLLIAAHAARPTHPKPVNQSLGNPRRSHPTRGRLRNLDPQVFEHCSRGRPGR
jgi:hypothetical protein